MKRLILGPILVCFFVTNLAGPFSYAQADPALLAGGGGRLPTPGVMVRLSPPFDPPILKGIKVHSENPFRFDFILDKGDVETPLMASLRNESTKLIKYFLASLTIPEKDLWVNLSPYEKDRIIPQNFGLTEMGRDLLAEDYMLKQITASLIYPEGEVGKRFWQRIYQEAAKEFHTTNVPVNTFNKVWIVPDKAVVYENAKTSTAYVVEAKLKVMLEEDYLSLFHHVIPAEAGIQKISSSGSPTKTFGGDKSSTNTLGSQILRAIVIPQLTKEVNENKNFSQLRQVYNSLILATWYKKKIKDSILAQVYADKNKTMGLSFPNALIGNPQHIYQQYLKAFKKGVYNYIKEEQDPLTKKAIPRKYFSGGEAFFNLTPTLSKATRQQAMAAVKAIGSTDHAMQVEVFIRLEPPQKKEIKEPNFTGSARKVLLGMLAALAISFAAGCGGNMPTSPSDGGNIPMSSLDGGNMPMSHLDGGNMPTRPSNLLNQQDIGKVLPAMGLNQLGLVQTSSQTIQIIQSYTDYFDQNQNPVTGLTLSFPGPYLGNTPPSDLVLYGADTYDISLYSMLHDIIGDDGGTRIINTYAQNNNYDVSTSNPNSPPTMYGSGAQGVVFSKIRIKNFTPDLLTTWSNWGGSVGDNAWIGRAALHNYVTHHNPRALRFAKERADWIVQTQQDPAPADGGFHFGEGLIKSVDDICHYKLIPFAIESMLWSIVRELLDWKHNGCVAINPE